MTECPVTPASGTWIGYFGVDAFAFELSAGDSELSGSGCIGGPPWSDIVPPYACAPLTILADRGRSVDFSWDTRAGGGYLAEFSLTLSPDRTAMAGSFWKSWDGTPPRESDPLDAVLVLFGPGPFSDATECSGGEPSGECFEHPLRADSMSERYTVAELGGGDLLLVWINQRALEVRAAVARFDAADDEWRRPTFVDTNEAYQLPAFSANRRGEGLLALGQPGVLTVKHYEVATDRWSEPEVVVAADPATSFWAKDVFVQDNGDATLIGTVRTPEAGESLFASEHDAATHAWGEPIPLGERVAEIAAAADAAGNVIVVFVGYPREPDAPFEVGFSRRSPNGTWSDPAILYTSQTQILGPAVAIGADGESVATWEEWRTRIGSSSYSPDTNAWSQPATISAEQFAENQRVTHTEDGRVRAYFYRFDLRAYEMSELDAGGWSAPEPALEADALGVNYSVALSYETIDVTRVGVGTEGSPIPALERATCEGY
jgi:hypothetical protein